MSPEYLKEEIITLIQDKRKAKKKRRIVMDLLDSISTLIFIILIELRTLAYVTITGNHNDNNHTGSLLMQNQSKTYMIKFIILN